MKGAQAILETLHRGGVDTIFANPGTSEMALVRALDEAGTVRGVAGDTILMAPPLITTKEQIDEIVAILYDSMRAFEAQVL